MKFLFSLNKTFLDWIEQPNLGGANVLVLNFIASELVAQLVENAAFIRDESASQRSSPLYERSIALEYYETVLKRNLGYRQARNLLFGYIKPSAAA